MHPLRDTWTRTLGETLQRELASYGLVLLQQGEEVGYDDWEAGGERVSVVSWWGVWSRGLVAA